MKMGVLSVHTGQTILGFSIAFLLTVASSMRAPASQASAPPMILFNGHIATLDDALPEAEAVVIRGKHLSFVGRSIDALGLREKGSTLIDLRGRLLVPGFIESHGHLLGIGRASVILNLAGSRDEDDVVRLVKAKAAVTRKGAWILGRGWDQNLWPTRTFPGLHKLSQVSPDHPVRLTRVDGHAAWYNQHALTLAKVSATTPDPEGGRIIRDHRGKPTGVLVDTAMGLVDRFLPPASPGEDREAIEFALAALLKAGVTSFHDAGATAKSIAIYKTLLAEDKLPVRLYVMINGADRSLREAYLKRGPEVGLGDDFLTIRSIKLMADGALGSRGAALLEPYADESNQAGNLILSQSELTRLTADALRAGLQVATHAIGDHSNRVVLNAYEEALRQVPLKIPPRLRIEHAQILHPTDLRRFAPLGVIASVQPVHGPSDMPWAVERLGLERAEERAYRWQSLRRSGAIVAFGSDAPVESYDPVKGLYAAIFRQDAHGVPAGGWQPEQRLSFYEALAAYTTGGAYAELSEERKGKLKVGYLADLVVFDKNLTESPQSDFLSTQVDLTVVNGKILFKRQPE